jgi:hypothetical protein
MARLLVHVEGQTEETFVNEILRDHLVAKGFHSVSARIVGNARQRGGIRPWVSVRTDIRNHLLEDLGCIATTMVDYYGLPQNWPGRVSSRTLGTVEQKARCVQDEVTKDLSDEMGSRFNSNRCVPFIVMHEFEGLLFSDCAAFSQGIGRPNLETRFREIRDQFATPEDINDSPNTAPSKRVENLVQGYQKPLFGVLAVLQIGLDGIRAACPHFNEWINRLEAVI